MKEKKPISGPKWDLNLKEAVALIQKNQNFIFCADLDPDSVGSMLALSLYLNSLGKKVYIVMSGSLGDNVNFFEKIIEYNSLKIVKNENSIKRIKDDVQSVIFFDTANSKLVPFYSTILEEILSKSPPVIEIDHHFGADSEEITNYGIKLFRNANANTEIIAELLSNLNEANPEFPNPFLQRNILIALITGLLGDTIGGKVVPFEEDFKYWIDALGNSLESVTRWRAGDGKRTADKKLQKFSSPDQVQRHMSRLDEAKQFCLDTIMKSVELSSGVASLNILNSTYENIKEISPPYDSDWFSEIRGFLLNAVPESSGKVGIIYFHGKNAEGKDSIFMKIRRAIDYSGFDLRESERKIKELFPGDEYMGGGGHPGAVSYRVKPIDEKEFKSKLQSIIFYLSSNLE